MANEQIVQANASGDTIPRFSENKFELGNKVLDNINKPMGASDIAVKSSEDAVPKIDEVLVGSLAVDEAEERKGIEILDSDNANIFLQRINKYRANREELNRSLIEKIKSNTEGEDLLDFSPVLLINFDDKILYSMFPEPASFEDYVPKGWNGKYEDFTILVPKLEQYWIDEFNNNLFLI
jgi:hypothetical protein